MNKLGKILVTVGAVFVFIILYVAIYAAYDEKMPGIIGLILLAGLIGALTAIWKKKSEDSSNNGSSLLQK